MAVLSFVAAVYRNAAVTSSRLLVAGINGNIICCAGTSLLLYGRSIVVSKELSMKDCLKLQHAAIICMLTAVVYASAARDSY